MTIKKWSFVNFTGRIVCWVTTMIEKQPFNIVLENVNYFTFSTKNNSTLGLLILDRFFQSSTSFYLIFRDVNCNENSFDKILFD